MKPLVKTKAKPILEEKEARALHTNLYFVVRVKSLDIGNVEDLVIEAIYIPIENEELIEWAKTFWPDSIGLVVYKDSAFVYCWWD